MKKNFLTAAAIMVTAFLLATTIAQASDVTMGGEFWTRYEVMERNDFNDDTEADSYFQSRIRLNATANINESTSAFIQLQSNRTWGDTNESGPTGADPAGISGSSSVNDQDTSVGVHQAYFTLKNLATLPVDAKVGRQEIILDGHRIFGNTLWTMGAHSHDAIRLDHKRGNLSLTYAYAQGAEEQRADDANDNHDVVTQVAYMNYAGILGGKFSALYSYTDDGCGVATASVCDNRENTVKTLGARQAGQLFGLDYRGEYYHQWGTATAHAYRSTALDNAYDPGLNDVTRDAYMFGVRVGKGFNNVAMKPKLTLWYDYLSGTSDEDASEGKYSSFNTVHATGHKFYGLQDVFLHIGNNHAQGTSGFGLQDAAIKTVLSPMPGWTLKADYHWFYTAEGIGGSPLRSGQTAGEMDNKLGNELDVTLVNKYNANTKIQIGYSNFTTATAFRQLRGTGSADANWFYTQVKVGF